MTRRKRKWDKSILLLILIVLVIVAAAVFGYFQLRTDLFTEMLEQGDPVAVLFCVSGDQQYGFFEILLYHPDTNRGAIIYIPGNVGMIIESLKKVDRIDVLYDRGNLNPLIDKIEDDYTRLGYVRERKNKILLYLVMTSRLMDTPLHSLLISRSGAGRACWSKSPNSYVHRRSFTV